MKYINNEWFLQNTKKAINLGLSAVLVAGLASGCSSNPTPTAPVEPPTVSEQVVETPKSTFEVLPEDVVVDEISFEEAVLELRDLREMVETKWEMKVPNESINCFYFLVNHRFFTPETVKQLIDNGIIFSTTDDIVMNAYPFVSAVNADNCITLMGGEAQLGDITPFFHGDEDQEMSKHTFQSLSTMEKDGDSKEEEVVQFCDWLLGPDEDAKFSSDYPYERGATTLSTQYAIFQCYAPSFSVVASDSHLWGSTFINADIFEGTTNSLVGFVDKAGNYQPRFGDEILECLEEATGEKEAAPAQKVLK